MREWKRFHIKSYATSHNVLDGLCNDEVYDVYESLERAEAVCKALNAEYAHLKILAIQLQE